MAEKYIDLIKGITKKYLGFNNNIEVLKIVKIKDDQKFYYDQKDLMCKVCVVPNTKSEIDVDMKGILELAINDEKVNMFFNLMNNNLNEWNNLYKKLEIVIDDLKSSNKYSNWIENSDSITKEKIKQFKQTANSYEAIGAIARHAKNIPAPKKIMKIKNAKMLVNKAVDDWLSLKIK